MRTYRALKNQNRQSSLSSNRKKPGILRLIGVNAVFAVLFGCFAVSSLNPAAVYGKTRKLAVFPFKINAESDYSYLQEGVSDMLYSRLADTPGIELIPQDDSDAGSARFGVPSNVFESMEIGKRLNADFVLYGSLTVLGNSVGIDAELTGIDQTRPPLRFIEHCKTLEDVIPAVSRFADRISDRLGRDANAAPHERKPPKARSDERKSPGQSRPEKTGDVQPPETTERAKTPAKRNTVDFVVSEDSRVIHGFNKIAEIESIVTAVAVGDIDGDGGNEVVIADDECLYAGRYADGVVENLERIHRNKYKNIIGLDIADLNQNNIHELYVTRLNSHRTAVHSMILEWDGGRFVKIVEKAPFYFKIDRKTDGTSRLLGQRYVPNEPYSGEITVLNRRGDELLSGEQIMRVSGHNLIGMALYHAPGNDAPLIAAYDEKGYIEVLNMKGAGMWKSSDRYGGSMAYHVLPKKERGSENRRYLQAPIRIADVNRDGTGEILIVKNHDISKGLLRDLKKFSHFQFCALSWEGGRLKEIWKTVKSPGYISDYRIGDIDNDGKDEMIAALVEKEGAHFFIKPLTGIVFHELPFGPSQSAN